MSAPGSEVPCLPAARQMPGWATEVDQEWGGRLSPTLLGGWDRPGVPLTSWEAHSWFSRELAEQRKPTSVSFQHHWAFLAPLHSANWQWAGGLWALPAATQRNRCGKPWPAGLWPNLLGALDLS